MSYKCEILADSINSQGDRITTMKITFPRFILAEFNTHRMFSRNSASSRAIPFKKMVKMVEENPFIPIAWQKDHKGMQGTDYFTDDNAGRIKTWLIARDVAVGQTKRLNEYYGVTKQLCNRLLEPFMWHTVIVTATEWENFFNLRCPQYELKQQINNNPEETFYFKSKKEYKKFFKKSFDNDVRYFSAVDDMTDLDWLNINQSQAEIHIQAIAELMWDAYNESTPKQLKADEWHIPFGDNMDIEEWYNSNKRPSAPYYSELDPDEIDKYLIKIATARCARISYETLGDNPKIDYEADIRLHDMLAKSGHASPAEHVALCTNDSNWYGNFRGWNQYRKILESQSLL